MKYLKLFENYSISKISKLLKNLPKNKDFQIFIEHTKSFKEKITRLSLIEGYCNDVTIFIKWLFPESEMMMSDSHSFIKYNNKYYDGYDYNGVESYNNLYFFKDNSPKYIKPFVDELNRIELLNKLFDSIDRLEILNEELNDELWYHGTDAEFSEFNEPDDKTKPTSKLGIWFAKDKDYAEYFGDKIINAELKYSKPYIISLNEWDDMRMEHAKDANYFNNLRQNLISQGYDAFYVTGKVDRFAGIYVEIPDNIAVFYKNQIEII